MKTFHRAVALPLVAALLASCATSAHDPAIDERVSGVEARLETAARPATVVTNDPLQISDSVWLGSRVVRMPQGIPLPSRWERDDSIALRTDNPIQLNQLVGVISAETKIPVRLTDGADTMSTGGAAPAPIAAPVNPGVAGGAPAPALPTLGGGGSASDNGIVLSYEGSLSGLLSLASSYFNVNWRYDGSSIIISRYVSRTFVMDALPGTITITAPEASTDGGGAASSAEVTPLSTASIDIWDDIRRTVESIVSGNGSVDISQSSGTVVVSTTADRMERVSRFLSEENKRLGRQVAISIELFNVEVDDTDAYGLDMTAALSSLGGFPAVNLAGPSPGLAGAGSVTITMVDPPALGGTEGIVQALSTLGKTTRVAQIPVTTLNNRPANQRIAVDTAYVSEISTTTSGVDNVSSQVETETLTTGLAVSVLPRIMSDGRILLQYALAQGELLNLEPFPIGDNTVQLPETQGISFSQQVMMKNGSTLILAGFDQTEVSKQARGMGRPLTWLLGGSTQSSNTRKMVVIAITPREIVVSRSEAS